MNTTQLKLNLIQQIMQVNDDLAVQKIQEFVSGLLKSKEHEKGSIQNNNRSDSHNDRENFNDYIKELVKEMSSK